jgi:transcriptional regulator with XRE-family HTH domain
MRIRAFRKLKGVTQHELAHLLGVSIAVVGAMERGIREPDHHMIQSISHVLGIEPRELSLKYM